MGPMVLISLPFSCQSGLRRALAEGIDHSPLRSFTNRLERIVYEDVRGGDDSVLC